MSCGINNNTCNEYLSRVDIEYGIILSLYFIDAAGKMGGFWNLQDPSQPSINNLLLYVHKIMLDCRLYDTWYSEILNFILYPQFVVVAVSLVVQ